MTQPVPVLHRLIAVVDVEGFSDPARTELHQDAVRRGLYEALQLSLSEIGIDPNACTIEDRGDGALILLPVTASAVTVAEQLPARLVSALKRHNAVAAGPATIRLRVALHAGQVREDRQGFGGTAVIHTFRLVDATELRTTLRESDGVLALIVSDEFYREVVARDPASEPEVYRRVDIQVKHTRAPAWLRTFDGRPRKQEQQGDLVELVDALLAVPTLRSEDGRRTLLELLRPEIANAVPYNPRPRLQVIGLLRTCLEYERGLENLMATLRDIEGGESLPIRRLGEIVRHWLSD
ncbi:hypothetical protein [Lentzea sp. NBRC 105346]|uniref:effector-associated domain 2-containing protein n=1 Tax=Lentzea sp. NBRC 105346 TaxID=3032205 RepID=UPI0025546B41|nr:hypothetical protein [Lentzea sp. NBRC 105346]